MEAALAVVRPIVEDVHHRGEAALIEYAAKFDGVELTAVKVPAAALTEAAGTAGPAGQGRAGGVDPARPHGARRPAPHRHDHAGRARRHRHRALGAGGPGRALRAGRPGRVSVLRGDERGARPGGRGRLAGRRLAAAEGVRRPAAPDDPGRVRPARRGRGLRRRRLPGRRDVRLRLRATQPATPSAAAPTWSPAPATSTSPPPSGCSRASSASTPRPARPRSWCSPTPSADPASSPPT